MKLAVRSPPRVLNATHDGTEQKINEQCTIIEAKRGDFMNNVLQQEFDQAITQSENLHLSNVQQSFLPVFIRVAKAEPAQATKAVDLVIRTIQVHRSNLISGLYILMRLAELSDTMRGIVLKAITEDRLEYYSDDADSSVAGNARILKAILLDHRSVSDFGSKSEQKKTISMNPLEQLGKKQREQWERDNAALQERTRQDNETRHQRELRVIKRVSDSGLTQNAFAVREIISIVQRDPEAEFYQPSLNDLGFADEIPAKSELHRLLNSLKKSGCLTYVETAGNSNFTIKGADVDKLRKELINFSGNAEEIAATPSGPMSKLGSRNYVNVERISELKSLTSVAFDVLRLTRLCEELNVAFSNEIFLSTAMLVRAVIDHVPPVFGKANFNDVASQYGSRSFKESMQNLNNSSRKISDAHLHTPIRSKEVLPNSTQVDFSNDLDMLLSEIYRVLK